MTRRITLDLEDCDIEDLLEVLRRISKQLETQAEMLSILMDAANDDD
jgi:hypothetical protein